MKRAYSVSTALLLLSFSALAQGPKYGRTAITGSQPPTHDRGGGTPLNDDCAGAIALTIGTTCTPTSGSAAGASQSMPPASDCVRYTSETADDVWFSFVATSAYTAIDITGTMSYDVVFQVFSGSCGTLELQRCVDDNFPDLDEPANTTETATLATEIDETYYIRVYSYFEEGMDLVDDTFTICAYQGEAPPPPPANNECVDAVDQALAVGSTITFSGDNTGATEDEEIGAVLVWHSFTTTECADVSIDYCVDGSVFDDYFIVIATDCEDIENTVVFGDSDGCTVTFPQLDAGTYLVPVLADADAPAGPYTVEVSAVACPPPPVNDECATATALTVSDNCSPLNGTTRAATETLPASECSEYTAEVANDVWYAFTAVSSSTTIEVTGESGFDAVVEVFDGACGAPTSLGCIDESTPTETLVAATTGGNAYYLRVYDYSPGSTTGFTICAYNTISTGVGGSQVGNWSIFPNPSMGTFTIEGSKLEGPATVEVRDMIGRLVYTTQRTLKAGASETFELGSELSTGTYNLSLVTSTGRTTRQVMLR